MGVKKQLLKGLKDAVTERKDRLNFLHNTSQDRLERIERMGGMPVPSIAVTKQSIPFEGFGDITLVGKPENFDPKLNPKNKAYSADAYTIRAPSPMRLAKKDAHKTFLNEYRAQFKKHDEYYDDIYSLLYDLEKKKTADSSVYSDLVNAIERRMSGIFLESKGIPYTKDNKYELMQEFKDNGEYGQYVKGITDKYLEPTEYFVTNPNRDRYTSSPKLKEYTADNITEFMAKNSGKGSEGGMAMQSAGGVRSSTAEELKSLDEMRAREGRLVSRDEMAEFKETSSMMLDDLAEAFKQHYDYDKNGFGYYREFNDFVSMSEKMGVNKALKEVGFSSVPKELIDELTEYKDMLRGGATEYFESKPKRTVDISEFGGAIVPNDASEATINRLKDKGLTIEYYDPKKPESRIEARKRFDNLAFSTGAGAAVAGGALYTPEENQAQAAVINAGNQVINTATENPLGEAANYAQDAANMVGYIPTAGMMTTSDIIGGVGKAGAALTGNLDTYEQKIAPYVERAGKTKSGLGIAAENVINAGMEKAAPYVIPYLTPIFNNVSRQWEQIEATPGDANLFGFIDELNRKSNAKLFR